MAYRFGHTVRLGCRLTDGKRGYACTRSQNLLRLVNAEAAADVCKKEQTNASAGCCSFHRRIPGGGFCSVTIRAQLQRTMLAEKLYLSRNDACMRLGMQVSTSNASVEATCFLPITLGCPADPDFTVLQGGETVSSDCALLGSLFTHHTDCTSTSRENRI